MFPSLVGLLSAYATASEPRLETRRGTEPGTSEPQRFHSCPNLIDFFQVENGGERSLVVLARGRDWVTVTMSLFGTDSGAAFRLIRTVPDLGSGIQSADGIRTGEEILFAFGSLGRVQWRRASLAELLHSSQRPHLEPVWYGELSSASARRVGPVTEWSTASLEPRRWLFVPRFIRGSSAPESVANAADGKILRIRPSTADHHAPGKAKFFRTASGGLAPQAAFASEVVVVAFLRPDGPRQPFWVFSNPASPGPRPPGGALIVLEKGKKEKNLSTALNLGPFIAHELVLGRDGSLLLFALRTDGVKSEVVALERRGPGGWALKGTQHFPSAFRRLSALAGPEGAWHLVLAEKLDDGWNLFDLLWTF